MVRERRETSNLIFRVFNKFLGMDLFELSLGLIHGYRANGFNLGHGVPVPNIAV